MTTTTTTTGITYHEVVWGDDEADRQTYADYGDGSYISRTAKQRATSTFLNLIRNGVPCGFWTNGTLTAGRNVTDGPDTPPVFTDDESAPAADSAPAEHKTRTVLNAGRSERYITKSNGSCGRWVKNDDSVALCTCGWKWHAGTRSEARAAARDHRTQMAVTV
jgi:hypothetical protein